MGRIQLADTRSRPRKARPRKDSRRAFWLRIERERQLRDEDYRRSWERQRDLEQKEFERQREAAKKAEEREREARKRYDEEMRRRAER